MLPLHPRTRARVEQHGLLDLLEADGLRRGFFRLLFGMLILVFVIVIVVFFLVAGG